MSGKVVDKFIVVKWQIAEFVSLLGGGVENIRGGVGEGGQGAAEPFAVARLLVSPLNTVVDVELVVGCGRYDQRPITRVSYFVHDPMVKFENLCDG